MIRRPPRSTLFPYTTLFRSNAPGVHRVGIALDFAEEEIHSGRHDEPVVRQIARSGFPLDRKSTRLNSSHTVMSYAVFCLRKKRHATLQRKSCRAETTRLACH